jgi:hypothetical protein
MLDPCRRSRDTRTFSSRKMSARTLTLIGGPLARPLTRMAGAIPQSYRPPDARNRVRRLWAHGGTCGRACGRALSNR